MRSTFTSAAALLGAISLASAQTFTDCNPTEKTCPSDAGLGSGNTFTTDFTAVTGTDAPDGWTYAAGTSLTYDSTSGANFAITTKTGAPTMSANKYIMFGKVTCIAKAAAGTGIVSSFILESDDLDEIDWEWLGSTDSSVESNFFGKGNTTTYDRALYHDVSTPIETWHTYVIDWTKDEINWSIDNTVVRTLKYTDSLTRGAAGVGSNYPQTPMLVKMGSWVGCPDASDASIAGTCSWAGGQAVFPGTYTMYIKSVTVEDYGCGGDYTYTDLTGSYTSISSSGTCDETSDSSSSSSSSSSSDKSSSVASSSTSTKGSASAGTSTTGGSATATGSSSVTSSGSDSATTSSSSKTTLTSSTSTKTSSSTSSTSTAATSTNAATKMGSFDYSVMGLGLALGYLVM